jgi:hypothetical protein
MLLEPVAQPVELRSRDSALTLADLWLRCYALGSMNTPEELAGFLRGELRPTRHEYNLVAVALNEYLIEIGAPQFVPYIEHSEVEGQAAPRCHGGRRSVDPARW